MQNKICQHHKYGYCKFLSRCQKKHLQGQCDALGECKELKSCDKRHPKPCRRFTVEKVCKFGVDCAYAHLESETSKLEKTVIDNVGSMKVEIFELKDALQRLAPNDEVGSELEKLKKEVVNLKAENSEIICKLKVIEEELKSYTTNKSDEKQGVLSCDYCSYESSKQEEYDSHLKRHNNKGGSELFKCNICDYDCEIMNMLGKHMSSKHPHMFNCDQCNYKTKKEFQLIKHKNTKHGTMNENRDHLETGKSKCVSKEDKICPICGEAYRTETDVECHFKEKTLD